MANGIRFSAKRFTHDCGACNRLGGARGADLYFCPIKRSIVARDGNDEGDYASMPAGVLLRLLEAKGGETNGDPLLIGARRARALRFVG